MEDEEESSMLKAVVRVTICLAITIAFLMVIACGQGSTGGSEGGRGLSPGVPGFLEKAAVWASNLFQGLGARITPGAQPNTRIVY